MNNINEEYKSNQLKRLFDISYNVNKSINKIEYTSLSNYVFVMEIF